MKKNFLIVCLLMVAAVPGMAQLKGPIDTARALQTVSAPVAGQSCPIRMQFGVNGNTVLVCPQSGTQVWTALGGGGGIATSDSPTLTGQWTFAAGTITTSKPLSITQTWNNAGTTFNPLLVNVTDTASATASTLADFQIGGTSKVKITKAGNIVASVGAASAPAFSFAGDEATGIYRPSANAVSVVLSGTAIWANYSNLFRMASGVVFGWASGDAISQSIDTQLRRAAAANLAFGAADAAAPVAQTLSVQNVVAGTTNTAGADWIHKGSAGTGTGAAGKMLFQLAGAGSSGTAQNPFATVLQLDAGANNATGLSVIGNAAGSGVTLQALSSGASETLSLLGKGTTALVRIGGLSTLSGLYVDSTVNSEIVTLYSNFSGAVRFLAASGGQIQLGTAGRLNWKDNADAAGGSVDLGLTRHAAGVLRVAGASTGAGRLLIGTSSDTSAAQLDVRSQTVGVPAGQFQAASGESSSATVLSVKNGAGTEVSKFTANGDLVMVGATSLITASGGTPIRASDSSTDIFFGGGSGMLLRSTGDQFIHIDTDNNTSNAKFQIRKDSASFGGGTLLFEVNESGLTTIADAGIALGRTITAGGTTGAQTINKSAFSVNFAAAATSLVVTNSVVTTTSGCLCTVQTNDATMTHVQAVPGSGSVTLYANAAPTAETKVYCEIRN